MASTPAHVADALTCMQLMSQRSSTSQHDRSPSLHDSPGAVSIPSVYRCFPLHMRQHV